MKLVYLLAWLTSRLFRRKAQPIIVVQLDDDADQPLVFPHQFAQTVARIYHSDQAAS